MTHYNMSGASDYSTGPRGAAVRDSSATSGTSTRASGHVGAVRPVKIDTSRFTTRGASPRRP